MTPLSDDLHRAVAETCQRHGMELLSRLVLCAEVVDERGEIGLLIGSAPSDMAAWDRAGMLRYALSDLEATVIVNRISEEE